MAALGNTPQALTTLRVEARKSFSFGLYLCDPTGRPVDLTGCRLVIVARAEPVAAEDPNLLGADSEAVIENPIDGYARFDLQAETLNLKPGEYPYAVVLYTSEGYSSVVVKGVLQLEQNTDFEALGEEFPQAQPAQRLDVILRENNAINVFLGGQLPPGMNYIRDDLMTLLEDFDPDSVAIVPPGGATGYALTKLSPTSYDFGWRPTGQSALDPVGQPAGYVPASQGDDTWEWAAVGVDASDAPAGSAPIADGAGSWDWGQVTMDEPDWSALPGEPGAIQNKPDLGTAAASDAEDFLPAETLLSQMPGVHFTDTIPTTGEDGHVYFVYGG